MTIPHSLLRAVHHAVQTDPLMQDPVAWRSRVRPDNIRRPGLVTEDLARHGDKHTVHVSEDWPILAPENVAGLTRAEWKVCFQVSQGLTAKVAADEIGVSVNTVRTHLRNIYVKTNLGSYYHLARRLVSPVEQLALYQRRLELSA